jgi:5-methylcytosine-specific restriction protein A
MMSRKEFKAYRDKLFKKHKRCYYCLCLINEPTLDHRIPLSRGGADEKNNLVLCCDVCNNKKGNMTEREFRQWLKHNS